MAGFQGSLGACEGSSRHPLDRWASKELVLLVEWVRPLHVVIVVDSARQEERLVTVYKPDPARWSPDLRRRR